MVVVSHLVIFGIIGAGWASVCIPVSILLYL